MGKIHLDVERGHSMAGSVSWAASEMYDSQARLSSSLSRLSHAWRGGSSSRFKRDFRDCLRKLDNSIDQLDQLGIALNRELEQWTAADADGMSRFGNLKSSRSLTGYNWQTASVVAGGALASTALLADAANQKLIPFQMPDGHTEYFLLDGREKEHYAGYLRGEVTGQELLDFLNEDPLKNKIITGKATFWSTEEAAKWAALDGQVSTNIGDFEGDLFSREAIRGGEISFTESKLKAVASGELGAYAAKGSYSKEMGALSLAAMGYVGANLSGEGGFTIDPEKLEVGATLGGEAFAGGKLEGAATLEKEVAGVDVSSTLHGGVSYGVGATAKGDIGFREGVFKAELEWGFTLGLGAEVGLSFEVDIQDAIDSVVDAAIESASQSQGSW